MKPNSLHVITFIAALAFVLPTVWLTSGAAEAAGDDYDRHYQLRIRELERQLEIYAGATDAASAEAAAKAWDALLPMEKEIIVFGDKLGLPTPERQKELEARYSPKIAELTTQVMTEAAEKSKQPWFRPIQLAQLRNRAAHGDESAAAALQALADGEPPMAPAALVDSWMKKAEALAALLGGLDDQKAASAETGASALAMTAELRQLDAQMREAGPAVSAAVARNDERIRKCMTGLLDSYRGLSEKPAKVLSPDLTKARTSLGELLRDD